MKKNNKLKPYYKQKGKVPPRRTLSSLTLPYFFVLLEGKESNSPAQLSNWDDF